MIWLAIAQVAGGVVLFLVGMKGLSTALRAAAGERLRTLLTASTASRGRGLALGTSVGFLAHSSAATVMTVGFVNAGLLALPAALPVLFGANIGTTLSMQLISFRLTDFALAAVAAGGALHLGMREGRGRLAGEALLGFGLLFLGMKISGDALLPYRDSLAPWLARIDGSNAAGMLVGVALSAAITAIVQSSGAVIGMSFVLAGSGVFTSLWQTFPLVLGAHIGTTATALLASLGTSAEARRAALANLGFNLGNAALGIALAGVFVPFLQATTSDLVHQTANAHTAVMVVAALLALPFSGPLAKLLRRLAWPSEPAPSTSHLDMRLLDAPEKALLAALHETGRCAQLASESLAIVRDGMTAPPGARGRRRVHRNEESIDEIRTSLRAFLQALARRPLLHRQALLIQSLNRCVIEVERVGDHVERLFKLACASRNSSLAGHDPTTRADVARLIAMALAVVECMTRSFTGDDHDLDGPSWETLEARNRYTREGLPIKSGVIARLSREELLPGHALVFSEITAMLDRIVRHCAVVAQEQRQPDFVIERSGSSPAAAG